VPFLAKSSGDAFAKLGQASGPGFLFRSADRLILSLPQPDGALVYERPFQRINQATHY
jgi:hypothetical protein